MTLSSEMEFRAYDDDAWYNVVVSVENSSLSSSASSSGLRLRLIVKFLGLMGHADVVFDANDFTAFTPDGICDFASRFRAVSQQLQDSECKDVFKGMNVCASHIFTNNDLRFYDAVVEGVDYHKHSFKGNEEACSCTFVLCWLHGPLKGFLTAEKIENICILKSGEERDPAVSTFLKRVRGMKEITRRSNSLPEPVVPTVTTAKHSTEKSMSNTGHELKLSHHVKQVTRVAGQSSNDTSSSTWMIDYLGERHDRDFGGSGKYYLIFVDNLEKEIAPGKIMEFVQKEVSISCQAFVFPSLSWELCTQGNILLDSKKSFAKLCNFLDNPDHIIVSSRGRPWLITEKTSMSDTLGASIRSLVLKSEKILTTTNCKTTDELKIVHSGTNEYKRAKQLRDLYKEFSDHQHRLHNRLAFEEEKILQL